MCADDDVVGAGEAYEAVAGGWRDEIPNRLAGDWIGVGGPCREPYEILPLRGVGDAMLGRNTVFCAPTSRDPAAVVCAWDAGGGAYTDVWYDGRCDGAGDGVGAGEGVVRLWRDAPGKDWVEV
jgi:hypothetical protein